MGKFRTTVMNPHTSARAELVVEAASGDAAISRVAAEGLVLEEIRKVDDSAAPSDETAWRSVMMRPPAPPEPSSAKPLAVYTVTPVEAALPKKVQVVWDLSFLLNVAVGVFLGIVAAAIAVPLGLMVLGAAAIAR